MDTDRNKNLVSGEKFNTSQDWILFNNVCYQYFWVDGFSIYLNPSEGLQLPTHT